MAQNILRFTPTPPLQACLAILVTACNLSKRTDTPPWVPIAHSSDLHVSLDTGRVGVDSVGMRVWLRFDYARPQRVSDSTRQFTRTEIEEYLDCRNERVRDIWLQLFDSAIRVGSVASDSSSWVPFRSHPASDMYFKLACDWLRQHRRVLDPSVPLALS